jgi:hypothetical protein
MRLRTVALVSLARQLSQHSSYLKLTLAGLLPPFEDHGRVAFFAVFLVGDAGPDTTTERPVAIAGCGPLGARG